MADTHNQITAREANQNYQKYLDAKTDEKLSKIYDLIRVTSVKSCSVRISDDLVNDDVVNELSRLGYKVLYVPDCDLFDISWENPA